MDVVTVALITNAVLVGLLVFVALKTNADLKEETSAKDRAYSERNALAIGFAKMARLAGYRAGHGIDTNPPEGWDPEWLHVVYVELPDGRQVSWHMSPDMVERAESLGEYGKPWDGTFHGRDLSWCEFEEKA